MLPQLIYDWNENAFFWGVKGSKTIGFYYRVMENEKYKIKIYGEEKWKEVNLEQFVMMLREVTLKVMAL